MKIIDLTHLTIPGEDRFKLKIDTYRADEYIPGYGQSKEDWHTIQEVLICSHVGTHVELPAHHIRDGKDASEIPLDKLMGEAIVLDFTHKKAGEKIELKEMKKAAAHMKKGDIILLKIGWSKHYGTEFHSALRRPSPTLDAIRWLAEEKDMHSIGVDATGIEDIDNVEEQAIHHFLYPRDIPIIEELTNLESISKERFFFVALPPKIKGLDSFPVRAIAIEEF